MTLSIVPPDSGPASGPALFAAIPSPGEYLHKRRAASGTTLREAAIALADFADVRPVAISDEFEIPPAMPGDFENLLRQLEASEVILTGVGAANLLRAAFRFDANVYRQLADLHLAGFGDAVRTSGLPIPHLCRVCACSFMDPCQIRHDVYGTSFKIAPCAWSETEIDLCTACERLVKEPGPDFEREISVTRHLRAIGALPKAAPKTAERGLNR